MEVIYNEIDPFATEWLVNLVAAGELPQGVVNTQSIRDLKGIDCGPTTHLFAGIGGWPLALRLAGWPDNRPVWTGSCPCQPYSAAGKGKGDADERNLWPEMYRLIRESRPPTIFGEQVAAAIGHGWIDGVRVDLEREGYAFGFHVLPACSVGSPNIRQRAFWVANDISAGLERRKDTTVKRRPIKSECSETGCVNGWVANTSESERRRRSLHDGGRASVLHAPIGGGAERLADDAKHGRRQGSSLVGRCDCGIRAERDGCGPADRCDACGLANANIPQLRGQPRAGEQPEHEQDGGVVCGMGDTDRQGRQGERGDDEAECSPAERASGDVDRLADTPSLPSSECGREPGSELGWQTGPQDAAKRGNNPWDDFRIIPCKDGKSRRVGRGVQPLAHGIPVQLRPLFAWLGRLGIDASQLTKMARLARRNRTGRLKGYGNAINPFVAAEFVKAFLAIDFEILK